MQINLISIIYKMFVCGLFVYLVVILDFGYLLVFDFLQMQICTTSHFYLQICMHPALQGTDFTSFFVIGFNFIGLFNLSLLDFCTCYFSFTSFMCLLLQLHCLSSTYPNYVCLLFVSISIYLIFFILSFMW